MSMCSALRVVSIEGRPIPAAIGEWQRTDRRRVEFLPGLYLNVVTYAACRTGQ